MPKNDPELLEPEFEDTAAIEAVASEQPLPKRRGGRKAATTVDKKDDDDEGEGVDDKRKKRFIIFVGKPGELILKLIIIIYQETSLIPSQRQTWKTFSRISVQI